MPEHLTMEELEAGLEEIRRSPTDNGTLKMIVRRPAVEKRELLQEAELDPEEGLVGDTWSKRSYHGTPADPRTQITVMNWRCIALVAPEEERRPLAGDQLYVDLDLSDANLPTGSQLSIGSAILEVTAPPHTGCKKFMGRFGLDAMKFVNSPVGNELHLRGICCQVVQAGTVRVGDLVQKLPV